MVRWWLGISVLLSMVVVLSAPRAIAQDETDCMDDPLGSAQDFEITAFGDLNLMNTDTEGPMAVGGNATLQSFTVNALRANQGYTGLALSVGKDVAFTNGSIWGGATVGGKATLTGVGGVTSLTQGT